MAKQDALEQFHTAIVNGVMAVSNLHRCDETTSEETFVEALNYLRAADEAMRGDDAIRLQFVRAVPFGAVVEFAGWKAPCYHQLAECILANVIDNVKANQDGGLDACVLLAIVRTTVNVFDFDELHCLLIQELARATTPTNKPDETKVSLTPQEYAIQLIGTTTYSVTKVASLVGVSRQQLYKMPNVYAAIRLRKSVTGDFIRGTKSPEGDMEAEYDR